jgi:Fe/S biogenesis protein NfuA
MITISDEAKSRINEYVSQMDGCVGIRIVARKMGGHHFAYDINLMTDGDVKDTDQVTDVDSFKAFLDPDSAANLEGASIDWVSDTTGAGFKIDNPQAVVSWDDPVAQKVQAVLDSKVAPSLASHGGWVELTRVEGDAAYIQFGGGCQGCGMSQVTLKEGIETAILADVPEIKRVLDGTDHDAGQNPYYQGS